MLSLIKRVLTSAGLAYYALFLGPRGKGLPPVPVKTWDAQYRTGHWKNFDSLDEMPRYAIIASYIRNYNVSPTVLDVGCGNGRLVRELNLAAIERYIGIDLSAEAINQTTRPDHAEVSFLVADFNQWRSDYRFHLIVFNDTLYYAQAPCELLERYAVMLHEDGALIVAMFRHRNTMIIWRDIARQFVTIDRIEVKDRKGEVTDIRVLRKPGQNSPG